MLKVIIFLFLLLLDICTLVSLLSNKHNFNLPARIGIDEFKGNCGSDKYQFHIFDLDTRKTIDIVKSRKYDDLDAYFSSFSLKQRCRVKVVSMDLYSPFKRVIKDKFSHATIVAYCSHFSKIVMNAIDELRLNLRRITEEKEKSFKKCLDDAKSCRRKEQFN